MEPSERTYSFACFPAERIAFFFGMLVGPAVAVSMLFHFNRAAIRAGVDFEEVLRMHYPAKPLAVGSLFFALVLVSYGALYLQLRGRTRLTLTEEGIRFVRERFLPFGLLERSIYMRWSDVLDVEYGTSRRYLFTRYELTVRSATEMIRVCVSDAWNESAGEKRPWMAKPPDSQKGWEDAELVREVMNRWKPEPKTDEESPKDANERG